MTDIKQTLSTIYVQRFGQPPTIYQSPGRVNLIGEHTDYNGGFVLPAAIDKGVYIAIAPTIGSEGRWVSIDLNEEITVDFDNPRPAIDQQWANYLLGVVMEYTDLGHEITAFNCVVAGDVPIGSGMSSSAALEAALAFAINEEQALGLSKQDLALLCQRVEHNYIGVQCGIMDMFASIHGKANHALRLDCQSLAYKYFPLELGECKIVLFDSGVKHNLVETEYNIRRQQCNEGLAFFRKHFDQNLPNLSAVPIDWLQASRTQMDDTIYARCQYVIEENTRIQAACNDLMAGNLKGFGIKMRATHEGLRNLYEVSCPELDFLVDTLWHDPEVLGSRMMGGGFGGCTINLIKTSAIDSIFDRLASTYEEVSGNKLKMYSVVTADGSGRI